MSLNTETKHTGLEVPHYIIVIKAVGEKNDTFSDITFYY